jgi:hypothetical protein
MFKLSKLDQHIILYCKLHYEITHPIKDIKAIVCKVCALPEKYIEAHRIYEIVLNLAFNVCRPKDIQDNLRRLFCGKTQQEDMVAVIVNLIQCICAVDVRFGNTVYIELPEPDYNILPPAQGARCGIGGNYYA